MTLPQILSVAVLAGMMLLFIWGRFRYDLVAIMALLAALALGIVKPRDAFSGFSDDIVVIVGSALVLSGAVQRSGVIESVMLVLQRRARSVRSQLLLLSASVGFAFSRSDRLMKKHAAVLVARAVATDCSRPASTPPDASTTKIAPSAAAKPSMTSAMKSG